LVLAGMFWAGERRDWLSNVRGRGERKAVLVGKGEGSAYPNS